MLKLRPLNSDRSTAGLASVSSQISQAIKPTMAITVITTIRVEWNQSSFLPRSSIICSAPTQTTQHDKPDLVDRQVAGRRLLSVGKSAPAYACAEQADRHVDEEDPVQ